MASNACLLARAKLAQYVAKLKDSSSVEQAGTAIKAGYLANPKTFIRNIVGNTAMGGMEYLGAQPVAVASDYLRAVAKSAATFGEIKPHEFRQMANTLNWGGFRAGRRGFQEGIAKGVQLLKTGLDPERVAEKFELGQTTFGSPAVDHAIHSVFNVMESADKPFFSFAVQTSLYGRARLMGIREGLTGSRLSTRINEILAKPTEEMVLGAVEDANYATFKNATALSDAAAALKGGLKRKMETAPPGRRAGLKGAYLASETILPFTKVPSALLKAGLDYSPVGLVNALTKASGLRQATGREISQGVARGAIGTGLVGLGYALAAKGLLHGSRPTSASDANLDTAEGVPQNSVNVHGTWRNVGILGPFAIPVLLGAALHEFQASDKNTGVASQAAATTASIGKTITEQSYLQGVANTIGALSDPVNKGATAIAGLVPVPSLVNATAAALDPSARQTSTVGEKLRAKLPGVSRGLPARLTQFGDTVARRNPGLSGAMESLFDPTNPRQAAPPDSPTATVVAELRKYDVGLPSQSRRIQVPGETGKRTLSPTDYNAILQEFGPIKRGMLLSIIQDPEYQTLPETEKGRVLEDALRDISRLGTDVTKGRLSGETIPRMTLRDVLDGGF